MRESIKDVKPLTKDLINYLLDIQSGGVINREFVGAVEESVSRARVLAAQLGCQRGVYTISDDVKLGERYDESRMTDAASTAEAGEELVVCCIISRGWVKKAHQGAQLFDVRVCKARVLVTIKDEM